MSETGIMVQSDELRGRHRIYTDVEEITENNVIEVLQEAILIHERNREEIAFLLAYEKGDQPLKREKKVRKEIDIKDIDNVANQVTEFKLGYDWGNPITYVQRGTKDLTGSDPERDDDGISMLNEMNDAEGAPAKDQELARYIEIAGIGFQMVDIKQEYEGDSAFDLLTLNPLFTFCIYRNTARQQKIAGVTYRTLKNGERYFTVYTKHRRFEIRNAQKIINGQNQPDDKWGFLPRSGECNPLAAVPIVEFIRAYDRMGCFERQIPDMDALNIEVSDFVNGVAQHVQEVWWGNDFDLPVNKETGEAEAPVSGQWLMTKTTQSGKTPIAKPLTSDVGYDGIQSNIGSKRNTILQKCYVPLQSDPGGGSTGTAMSMSSGWSAAEASACKKELIIRRSKMEIVRLELAAIKKSPDIPQNSPLLQLKPSDVYPKFTRQKTFDLGTKTNSMVAMIKAGIHGRIAMQTVDLFPDVAQAWNDSKDLIEKFQESLFQKKEAEGDNREQQDLTDQIGNSPILDGMSTEKTNIKAAE